MRISFKRQPKPTGLSAIANPYPTTDIKTGGKNIGFISPPSRLIQKERWTVFIRLLRPLPLPDGENCIWHNVKIDSEFPDEESARTFVTEMLPNFATKHKIHPEE